MRRGSSFGLPDGFDIYDGGHVGGAGYTLVGSKAAREPRLNLAERTAIVPILGQSNSANYMAGGHTPTNTSKVDQLNFFNGGVYEAKDLLLGAGGAVGHCVGTRLADELIDGDLYDRVILCPFGIGSSNAQQWAEGVLKHRIAVMAKRMAAHGYVDTFTLFHLGEAHNTSDGVGLEGWLQDIIDEFRLQGLAGPFFVSQVSWLSTADPSNAGVRAAQAAVVNEAANVFLGPDTDTITGTGRYDDLHFNATGSQTFAELAFDKIAAWHANL